MRRERVKNSLRVKSKPQVPDDVYNKWVSSVVRFSRSQSVKYIFIIHRLNPSVVTANPKIINR
jgi:hypothetical protein